MNKILSTPIIFSICIFACLSSSIIHAAEISVLFNKDLPDIPGKTVQILTVDYAPGESSKQHRHNANTFVYVLEGSVVMQVEGSKEKTLLVGEIFYENPDDIHSVSRNANDTESAKILVFFVKDKDTPSTVPAH